MRSPFTWISKWSSSCRCTSERSPGASLSTHTRTRSSSNTTLLPTPPSSRAMRETLSGYDDGMPRSIWNGTISFGLVNVPVGLYSAIQPKSISFHEVTKSGHRIRHKRVDEKTGREVDYDAIVKGYERTKGRMVLVEPEELAAAAPKQTRTIEIEDFVDLADIDPIYYNSTYYVAPRSG